MLRQPSLLFIVSLLCGACSQSIDGGIAACNDEAARAAVHLLPNSDTAKEHIRDQEQGFFFRCMKSKGFAPSKRHSDEKADMIRKAFPNADSKLFYEKLNKITRQTMRDPNSGYWER